MKKFKFILIVAMSLILSVMFTGCNSVEEPVKKMDFKLIKGNSEYELVKVHNLENTIFKIPRTHEGKPVTSIGKEAFLGQGNLTKIYIPDSITSINDKAFDSCKGLKYIYLPESIKSLGSNLFNNCDDIVICYTNLHNLKDSTNLMEESKSKSIVPCKKGGKTETGLIYGVENNNTITIYNYIGNSKSLEIPTKIDNIKVTNIANCSYNSVCNKNVLEIKLPNTITNIEVNAFSKYPKLEKINLPISVTNVGENAFSECKNITINCETFEEPDDWDENWDTLLENSKCKVIWGQNDTKKEYNNFIYSYNQNGKIIICNYFGEDTEVEIPKEIEGVEVVGIAENAFYNKENITKILIPNSIKEISKNVFCNLNSTLYCEATEEPENWKYNWNNGNIYFWGQKSFNQVFNGFKYSYLNDGTIAINSYSGDTTELEIPSKINNVKVTKLCKNSIVSNYGLLKLFIPESVNIINENAIGNCDYLTIYCEATERPIGWSSDWFDHWSNIKVRWGQESINQNFNGFKYSNLTDGTIAINNYDGDATELEIPRKINDKQVVKINEEAFNYENLTKVFIPNCVKKINKNAFINCSNLIIYCEATERPSGWSSDWINCWNDNIEVVWGQKSLNQSYNGFKYSNQKDGTIAINSYNGDATELIIPKKINDKKVVKINEDAFFSNENLTKVFISNCVTKINKNAFNKCKNLTIYCEATEQPVDWENNWNNSTKVIWGQKSLNQSFNGFQYSYLNEETIALNKYNGNLSELEIPSEINGIKVVKLYKNIFYNNKLLEKIFIPNGINIIDENSFEGCNATIYCEVIKQPEDWGINWNSGNVILWGQKSLYQNCNGFDYYYLDDEKIAINKYNGDKTELEIPKEIDNKIVSKINANAFYNNENINKVLIPNCIKKINKNAFYNCNNLSIYCEATEQPVEWDKNWNNSTNVLWGQKSLNQSYNGFKYSNLKDGTIAINRYDGDATELEIPRKINDKQVVKINEKAFYYENLTKVFIPNCVKKINKNAFYKCDNLIIYCEATEQPVDWDNNWNNSTNVIWGQKSLNQNIDGFQYSYLNDEKIAINNYNGNETELVIPKKLNNLDVTTINSKSFCNNDLRKILILNNILIIGENAFYGCHDLTIYCEATEQPKDWNNDWNEVWNSDEYNYNRLPILWGYKKFNQIYKDFEYRFLNDGTIELVNYKGNDKRVKIPSQIENLSVSTISTIAFKNNKTIEGIFIPKSIISIGKIFYYCKKLTTICCEVSSRPDEWNKNWNLKKPTYEDSYIVTTLWAQKGLPENCNGYQYGYNENGKLVLTQYSGDEKTLIIPKEINGIEVEEIKERTFNYYNFDKVFIPKNIKKIEENSFYKCQDLILYCEAYSAPYGWKRLSYYGCKILWGQKDFNQIYNGFKYSYRYDGTIAIIGYEGEEAEIIIPNKINNVAVTSIESESFDNKYVKKILIPDSIQYIGKKAFYKINATLYLEVASIPEQWDYNWYSTEDAFDYRLQLLYGQKSFNQNFKGLKYSYLRDGTLIINDYCGDAEELEIPSKIDNVNVTKIDRGAFYKNKKLKNVIIPNGIISIGSYAFASCENLEHVSISSTVEELCNNVFGNDYKLKKLFIPKNVTSMGSNLCFQCTNTTICCEVLKKPEHWSQYWQGANLQVRWGQKSLNQIYNGFEYSYLEDGTIKLTKYKENQKDITVPNQIDNVKVSTLGSNLLYRKYNVENIFIPKSVSVIEEDAFYDCNRLFIACEALEKPQDWNNNWNRDKYCKINDNKFIKVVWGQKEMPKNYNGLKYVYDNNGEILIVGYKGENKEIEIPNQINDTKVIKVIKGAFFNNDNNKNLEKVYIPKDIIVEKEAFYGCCHLTIYCEEETKPEIWNENWNIQLENQNVKTLWGQNKMPQDYNGFQYGYLENGNIVIAGYSGDAIELEIPNAINGKKVEKIISHAFYNNTKLKKVFIPNSILEIDSNTFYEFDNSKLLIFCEAKEKPEKWIDKWKNGQSDSVAKIVWGQKNVSQDFNELKYIYLEDGTIEIYDYVGGKKELEIPKQIDNLNVTKFAFKCFYGNTLLEKIYIPDTIENITLGTFCGCDNLYIYCESESKPDSWDEGWNDKDYDLYPVKAKVFWNQSLEAFRNA